MKMVERAIIFSVQQNSVVCRFEDFFLKANGLVRFNGLNLLALPTMARILCLDSS
jgi:hypothetical protein